MKCLMVAGGTVDINQLKEIYNSNPDLYVIGVDRGGLVLCENEIKTHKLIGDYDSLSAEEKKKVFEFVTDSLDSQEPLQEPLIEELIPEKDDTDTEHAFRFALSIKPEEIIMMGCTGTRMDHTYACIRMLKLAAEAGVKAYILDKTNRIRVIKGGITLSKDDQFGKYISVFPYGDSVCVSLKGFKYEVEDVTLTSDISRGVSNEFAESEGIISIKDKNDYVIVMETND